MRSSIAPVLLWAYWANLIYLIGMVGYLILDIISSASQRLNPVVSCYLYLFLSIVFVIDAALYTIDWYIYAVKLRANSTEPIEYRCELVACIFLNIGSWFYFIGALLAFDQIQSVKNTYLFYLLGIIAFLIESFFSTIGWSVTIRNRSVHRLVDAFNFKNVYLWAHSMGILANSIYLCAIGSTFHLTVNHIDSIGYGTILLQIIGDFVYLVDAYLYHLCWKIERREHDDHTERENLVKISESSK